MTDAKLKTILDLKNALEAHGMESEAVNGAIEIVMKAVGTKYMMELYAEVSKEVVVKVQTMSKDQAATTLHEAYFEKTGKLATDRLDEIISVTIEDMIEKPGDYFQKKGE